MNKNKMRTKVLVIFSLLAAAAVVACSPINYGQPNASNLHTERNLENSREGYGNYIGGGQRERGADNESKYNGIQSVAVGELTTSEIDGLLFMREEEKLAGDVYRYFYERWGDRVFKSIASSEDMHTQTVQELLDMYGIVDPASAQPGVFQNADLQTLYDQLTAQGSLSQKDALLVSAVIEEIDIIDLDKYIADTNNVYIVNVYENLRNGSENHLQAFTRVLENQYGESYIPTHLSMEHYTAIMNESAGMGGYGGGNAALGNMRRGRFYQ